MLIVGASSGIGRAAAFWAVQRGTSVVMAARRTERLTDLIAEAGGGLAVPGDVRQPESCRRIVEQAVDRLGAIDVLLYTVGAGTLRYFADVTAEDWRLALETNVIGPHQLIRAALDSLSPEAIVAVLSSESVGQPYTALGTYRTTKAAMEESMRAWRTEHPTVRFCCVIQGATVPSEFANDFDPALMREVTMQWARHGVVAAAGMTADSVAEVLVTTLAAAVDRPGVGIEQVVLRPPAPVIGPSEMMKLFFGEELVDQ